MTVKNRCGYFDMMERGIDKFIQIVMDIVWFAVITAIISISFWYVMTAIASWMETRGF